MPDSFNCLKAGCSHCCINTKMPLSIADIKRLMKLGHKKTDFLAVTNGERRLRNIAGKCVFLGDHGCKVYPDRPQGCRFYPLVVNQNNVVIDPDCKHSHQFKVDPDEAEKLLKYLKQLKRERRRELK